MERRMEREGPLSRPTAKAVPQAAASMLWAVGLRSIPMLPRCHRLTWLGDAVLGATVSDLLFAALPDAPVSTLHDCRKVRTSKACRGLLLSGLPLHSPQPKQPMLFVPAVQRDANPRSPC